MELQGWQMWIVFGRSERDAKVDVHGALERFTARPAGDDRADESVSGRERFDHGCVVEFFGEAKNQAV